MTPGLNIGASGQTPSAQAVGTDLLAYVRVSSGHLLQWHDPGTGQWQVTDVSSLAGGITISALGPVRQAAGGRQQMFVVS